MTDKPFVSRGGEKLDAALTAFGLAVEGWTCADFGCNVGGFVDCLLRRGARRVYAVDAGYGALAWTLCKDPRVVVMERTNALHYVCPEPCDLITIDVGWTPQRLILPAARRCLKPETGRVITLIKPQYEVPPAWLQDGVVLPERLPEAAEACRADVGGQGWRILAEIVSPLRGHGGNVELLWLLQPA